MMLVDIVTVLIYVGLASIAFLITGFCMTKFIVYTTIASTIFWAIAPLAPFSRNEVEHLFPVIIEMLTIYPQAIDRALQAMGLEHGLLGVSVMAILGIGFAFPYVYGHYLGFRYWPELILLRIFF